MTSQTDVNDKARKYYQKSRDARSKSDVDAALKFIEKALDEEPQWIDAYIELAALQHSAGSTDKAIEALESAIAIDSLYEPRILNSLAGLYAEQQHFRKAARLLSAYLQAPGVEVVEREKLEHELRALPWRAEAVEHPVDFSPVALGPPINTAYDEALPAFTADGKIMLFTRRIHGQEDLYYTISDGEQWGEPEAMSFNTAKNEGAHAVSADGRTIIFTACNHRDGYGNCDLFVTTYVKGGWTNPENLGPEINTDAWESHPSMTSDGTKLYFSSNRPGGYGGRDIWLASRKPGGEWRDPRPLDSVINTAGNEESPFIHADGRTMYFMSDGHIGMGDYDIFLTRATADGWSQPDNLGYPINTNGREGALAVHPNGVHAYYTSDKIAMVDSRLRKNTDLYKFELPEDIRPHPVTYVEGHVTDAITGQPLIAEIRVFPLEGDSSVLTRSVLSHEDGAFVVCLPNGDDFGLHVVARGYVFYSDRFGLSEQGEYASRKLKVEMEPIPVTDAGEITGRTDTMILKNIYFKHGSAELMASSEPELLSLYKLLEKYPAMRVELRGHTDNTGTQAFNLELSKARAQAVKDWLVAKGIVDNRIVANGFGDTMPIADNATDEGRQQNRRTEFIILEGNK